MGKTEEPTPKRLRKAREEGNSPLSTSATQAVAFLVAIAVAPAAASALSARVEEELRRAIARASDAPPRVTFEPTELATAVLGISAPILAAAAVSGAIVSLVQTGGVLSTKKLAPNLGKLNPIAGLGQLLSAPRGIAVLRAFLFAATVVWIAYGTLRTNVAPLASAVGRIASAEALATTMAIELAKKAAIVGLFLAVIDVVVTRRSWRKKLMMSKDEVKREHKESEGDPEVKAARERAHHEMLSAATVANVKHANVVIVNPTHIACALRYDSPARGGGDEAPVLVASGHGDLARRIVLAAHQYGVPVLRDVPLARALVELDIGDEIPEALYEAVAEILREAWESGAPGGAPTG